jgi:hypothetical protein
MAQYIREAQVLKMSNKAAGLEKFQAYAKPRKIFLRENTYGFYKVTHARKTSVLEACRAAMVDRNGQTVTGWLLNLANKQRVFKPDAAGYQVYPVAV